MPLRLAELSIGTQGHLFLGVTRQLTVPAPAPGAGSSLVLPSAGRWRPLLYHAQLTTDANVAPRQVALSVQDADGNELGAFPAGFAHTAGLVVRYTWAIEAGDTPALPATGQAAKVTMPDLMLEAGYRLAVLVAGAQVGDQLGAGSLWVEEYDTSPGAYPADVAYPFAGYHHPEG